MIRAGAGSAHWQKLSSFGIEWHKHNAAISTNYSNLMGFFETTIVIDIL